jgi:hypothetical protein
VEQRGVFTDFAVGESRGDELSHLTMWLPIKCNQSFMSDLVRFSVLLSQCRLINTHNMMHVGARKVVNVIHELDETEVLKRDIHHFCVALTSDLNTWLTANGSITMTSPEPIGPGR